MNKAPSFTPRDEIPSPTTSTWRGSSGPSTYAPSVADSTTSLPSTTTTATSSSWRRRTGRGSARGYVPPAAANQFDFSGTGQHRLVIGIDYGTTFTGIAWAIPDTDRANIDVIHIVTNWNSPKMGNDVKIPSVISYSAPGVDDEQQFGYDISPDAITMVNTKLELEPQGERVDELDLILQVLEGMRNLNFDHVKSVRSFPGYTWKGPDEVVTDYLTKAFECFDESTKYIDDLKPTVPVDIVITTPVTWSYRAKNSTLRAIQRAGFNELNFPGLQRILLVTEPEAAAIYTAQYFKQGAELLKEKECFVLCDAGGGTVDVVAYKVMQVEPNLQLEAITIPTGAKCGASFINANFREWLREVLGERNYAHLDPLSDNQRINAQAMETAEMRQLMSKFEVVKKLFCADSDDVELDLPAPLHMLNIPGRVEQGSLTITHDDMQSFFDPCVDDIIELIDGQIAQVEARKNRVKSIFLVGGFSESKFLREELDKSINELRDKKIRLPATSWSAVVRGAVLFGMEESNRQTQATVKPCPKSYGISTSRAYTKRLFSDQDKETSAITNQTLAKGQLTWFIRKGDMLQLSEPRIFQQELYWHFVEGQQRYVSLPIYEYLDDDIPMRYENAHEELKTAATLTADLNSISLFEMEELENRMTGRAFYQACLVCKWTVSGATLKGELLWGEKVMNTIVLQNIDQL